MVDVAAAAGVSHQTVSRVINGSAHVREETRIRVEAAISDLGYRRNSAGRELASRRSGRIGLIGAHLAEHGPATLSLAVHDAARRAGFEILSIALADWEPGSFTEAFDRLLDQSVEAIVLAVTHRDAVSAIRSLPQGPPVVIVSGAEEDHPLSVGIDNEPGARIATKHLLDHGHSRVALVSGPLEWIESQQRAAGWLAAHVERDIEPGPVEVGDWTPSSGYRAGSVLAIDPSLSAIFVANDQMALGVLGALKDAGRAVPHDVSVVGFDDLPEAAYYCPPLTTIHQDLAEVGRRAVELAVEAIQGQVRTGSVRIEPHLVARDSSTARA